MDPNLFFDEVPGKAIKVCKTCEVRLECLGEALQYDTDGVFGGTTGPDRRRMKAMLSAISFASNGVVDIPIQLSQKPDSRTDNNTLDISKPLAI